MMKWRIPVAALQEGGSSHSGEGDLEVFRPIGTCTPSHAQQEDHA